MPARRGWALALGALLVSSGCGAARDDPAGAQALPGAVTREGRSSRVVGTMPAADLERLTRLADQAATTVTAAWPQGWSHRVEVVAPATSRDYDAVLGRVGSAEPPTVAALTTGSVGADGLARDDRVVLNPTGWAALSEQGRQVVLTHETVHVATRASVPGRAPAWLAEGFAEQVAYAAAPVSRPDLTASLRRRVAAGWRPADLPTAAELDPSSPDVEATYLAAWLAVEEVASVGGPDAPRRLLRACSRHGGTEADLERACADAIPAVLGVSRAELVRRWQARLTAL